MGDGLEVQQHSSGSADDDESGRHVIVHYHIFKNAGTSVDAGLQASFGDTWAPFEGQHASDVQTAGVLKAFLETRPGIEAVSTHLGRPPLPWRGCLPIVFLRHPLLRARSVYTFTRNDPSQPFSEAAAQGFAGYIRWALDGHGNGVVIRNYQVVHLSGASFRAPHIHQAEATNDDLRQCCDLLAGWGMAGIVERFGESARTYQRIYAHRVPRLQLAPLWLNRTHTPAADIASELEAIRSTLGARLYDALLEHNRLDLTLYEVGQRLQQNACAKA